MPHNPILGISSPPQFLLVPVAPFPVLPVPPRTPILSSQGFWTRFFPAWKRLRALVDEGALGECRVLQGALAFPLRAVERLREPSLGGGALLDLGGYGLQMASALLGRGCPPLRLRAEGCLHPSGKEGVLWGLGCSHWGEEGPPGCVGEACRGVWDFYGWVVFFGGGRGLGAGRPMGCNKGVWVHYGVWVVL